MSGLRSFATDFGARRPVAVDGASAVVVMVVTSADRGFEQQTRWLWLLHAALVLPLVWRRRAPMPMFCVVAALAFVQWVVLVHVMPADIAVLIALYTVAAHSSRLPTWTALAVAETGAFLAALSGAPLHRHSTSEVHITKTFVLYSGTVVAAVVLGLNTRGRRARLAVLEQRAADLERERDQQAALAVAAERSRIAREMHDIVTHSLSVMVALADGSVYANDRTPRKATAAMQQCAETGRQALTDMRRFLGVLRDDEPDALRHPQPGIEELAELVQQVRAAGHPTELDVDGAAELLSPGAQLTVYRLVQESLTNVLKHSRAGSQAWVALRWTSHELSVEIRDNGYQEGARAERAERAGHGLVGMRERTTAFGGTLAAGPDPDHGWCVKATLDLTTTNAAGSGPLRNAREQA
ncbi:sensor histidine kinase [Streptacidiphilus sp. PAMC 29251]